MAPSATSSRGRLYGALGAGALLVGGLAYVGLGDPHSARFFFPACPFYALTGWYCPGCGGLRMTHDLLHGDLASAVTDNVFLLVALPLLLVWVLVSRYRGRQAMTASAIGVILVAVVAWTVARNLPGFPLVPTVLG
ncbi:DUF2752 domain-containing protein [Mycolicibacterium sp. XJ1819]